MPMNAGGTDLLRKLRDFKQSTNLLLGGSTVGSVAGGTQTFVESGGPTPTLQSAIDQAREILAEARAQGNDRAIIEVTDRVAELKRAKRAGTF